PPLPWLAPTALDGDSAALARQRARVMGVSVAAPMLALLLLSQTRYALFAALAGVVVGLSDARATALRRVEGAIAVLCVVAAFAASGLAVQGREWMIVAGTLLLATAASSIPPEYRAIGFVARYCAVAFNIGAHQSITSYSVVAAFGLAGLGACAVVLVDALAIPHTSAVASGMRHEFEAVRTGRKGARNSRIFAICAGLSVAGALYWADRAHLERPYWVMATVIFVLHPDPASSFKRIAERALGVIIGALATAPFVQWTHTLLPLVLLVVVVAWFVPLALPRRYWLGVALMTILIMTLADISALSREGAGLPYLWVRVENTLLGCGFAAAGTLLALGLTRLRRRA
ncbi:MAG: FUSC family protein, partial [Deltaproteobacteria bacterium]|nr:FUSC family protein [Deltaproteobacteria bacterium]